MTPADTYASKEDLVKYAGARGILLDDTNIESSLTLAMDKLDVYDIAEEYKAPPHKNLIKAQCILAVAAMEGKPLFNNTTSEDRIIKREKIDVLEFEYLTPDQFDGTIPQPSFPEVDALLEPLLDNSMWTGRTVVRRS